VAASRTGRHPADDATLEALCESRLAAAADDDRRI
jgi:hypothetical protein